MQIIRAAGQIACALAVVLATATASSDTNAVYPANPAVVAQAVYVSSQGVTRLQRETLRPVWRALSGVETLAPVVTPSAVLVASTRGLYAL
ncbi:MAG: hypothetical protein ACE5LB_03295, partial [Acidiferrobacterales bacterium]